MPNSLVYGCWIWLFFVAFLDFELFCFVEKAAIEGLRFQDQHLLMSWFDSRKSTKQIKKEEESAIDVAEGESNIGENANDTEAEKKFSIEDSESEVELIVEDDDYKDEELSNSVTIGFDEVSL